MPRIGILTCWNCTQELNCASAVCLADMRKKRGFFEKYKDQETVLVGIISCAGCPTIGAPEKILKRVKSLASFKVDAIHLSYCMTSVCPFVNKYLDVIKEKYPDIEIVEGTHKPRDKTIFRGEVCELLSVRTKDMTDLILTHMSAKKPE
ncbi:CGGC domain-containing protein [Pelotomaculum isophthalicicum JI]|uniref:CGGC domain-containing protein n=1 Tax=Pelotomaculum isophthalicicum JI TaxID=947010 RepID=A0A9X4H2R0_9FIRM|nr:CGGC domain-containing protein [Pelotomaculum isophthalicicum]MDF9409081.1 CGGC domain-containing protein [Pelotomaculum isophthalicicum JI]